MTKPWVKRLKTEMLVYGGLYVALASFMHPERISLITSPLQLAHSFLWVLLVYGALFPVRIIVTKTITKLRRR